MSRPQMTDEQLNKLLWIQNALGHLRSARKLLRLAKASKSADYVQRAIKSVQGAERHAEAAPYREERRKGKS